MRLEEHMHILGVKRRYHKRMQEKCDIALKLAVVQAFQGGMKQNHIMALTNLSRSTIQIWLAGVKRGVPRSNEQR